MRKGGSGEFALLTQLDSDVDDAHLLLRPPPQGGLDYASFLGLRSGKNFFARLTQQEFERSSELLRAMFAISVALAVKAEETIRQRDVFQTRLATAVSSMVGVHVHLGGGIPTAVRGKLMRAMQRGMRVANKNVIRLEAAAALLSFLLECGARDATSSSRRSTGREVPTGELTVYIRETGN